MSYDAMCKESFISRISMSGMSIKWASLLTFDLPEGRGSPTDAWGGGYGGGRRGVTVG